MTDSRMNERPPISRIDRNEARMLEVSPWDIIARSRARDLDAGKDLSYRYVIAPHILKLVGNQRSSIIDIGCGVGRLTRQLSTYSNDVVGVDPSETSADLAELHVADLPSVKIESTTARGYRDLNPGATFEMAIFSMVLQDIVDLDSTLQDAARLVRAGGSMAIAITHPFFWPKYWGYDRAPWFDYQRELFLRTEFRTSTTRSGIETMHCHRPLYRYFSAINHAGFQVEKILEPNLPSSIQRQTGVHWNEPHFMFISCKRTAKPA